MDKPSSEQLYPMLLRAIPDTVLVVRDEVIIDASLGDLGWLTSGKLLGLRLTELLSEHHQSNLSESLQTAHQFPGTEVKLDAVIAPDTPPLWAELGMQKAIQFEIRLVALDSQFLICLLRDCTELRRLQKRLDSAVMNDPLTGLSSHRAIIPVLTQMIGAAQRQEENRFSMILIDIDRFSDINERFGWDCGDQVLRAIAGMLSEQKRSSDFLCRFGEDLFAIVLGDTGVEQALLAGQRICRLVTELGLKHQGLPIDLTVSVGIATQTPEISKPQDMIHIAQENLLIAISRGGNDVTGPV